MREYGNSLALSLPTDSVEIDPELLASARRMLAFNYRQTRGKYPELPEEGWEFGHRVGERAWESEGCAACRGEGSTDSYVCPACEGQGFIYTRPVEPPHWVHYFSWRICVEE